MPTKTLQNLLREHKESIHFGDAVIDHHKFYSNLFALNLAMSKDAYIPGGSVVQLIGEPSQGKSTLALDFIAAAQQSGIKEIEIPQGKHTRIINAVYVDFEHTFDAFYAETLGVDTAKLLIVETRYGEESFDLVEALLTEGLQMVVIDSIPMFESKSEEDKSFQDSEKMSANANPLTRIMRRLLHLTVAADALLLVINQYRANISTMSRKEKKAYGARAVQYISRVIIELVRISKTENRTEVAATVIKTKLGAEGKQINFEIEFGEGIDYDQHIFNQAVNTGLIDKNNSYYTYRGTKVQGEQNAIAAFNMEEIKRFLKTGEIPEGTTAAYTGKTKRLEMVGVNE